MGVLSGYKIIEMAGIGPAPFCGMLLADMGADVLRIDRVSVSDLGLDIGADPRYGILGRGKRSVAVDIKSREGRALVLDLVKDADALIEGFRPGVMERLGLGPEDCLNVNPGLVFGRVTGWGQDGPMATTAGHDIDYIALSGVLHSVGQSGGRPLPPLNLIGDFGGGAMFLAVGIMGALLERVRSNKGQVIDAAMVDGSAYLMAAIHGLMAKGMWRDERGANILDGAAPFYRTYETRDGKHVAVGAIERRFFAELLDRLGLAGETLPDQRDETGWQRMSERFAEIFRTRTREEWCRIFEGGNACFAPVLSLNEAYEDVHLKERETFVSVEDIPQPAPAPRFSRTASTIKRAPPATGQHGREALADWGIASGRVKDLIASGTVVAGREEIQ